MLGRAFDIKARAGFGGIQKAGIAGQRIDRAKPIQRPAQAARPARIVAPTLLGRLV